MEKYRNGVGVILINKDKNIYLFERSDVPNSWQCPEGGIDKGENPLDGALREMEEEVGISKNKVKLLAKTKDFIPYIIPEKFRRFDNIGQRKKFFLFEFLGNNKDFKFNKTEEVEFTNFKIIDPDELLGHIVNFKKDMYKKILEEFKPYLRG
jgi:putative (di)nucleoside polyphosphate hydrolase